MLSIILLILQVIAIISYPPILASIYLGENVIEYLDYKTCKDIDDLTSEIGIKIKKDCDKLINVKYQIYAATICFILALIMYTISIYFEYKKNEKLFFICISIGVIFSISSLVLLFSIPITIVRITNKIDKELKTNLNIKLSDLVYTFKNIDVSNDTISRYVWHGSILSIMFTLFTIIISVVNIIMYLKSKKKK